jgi:glycosyltransferase involved in cell wall biosynthesis
MKISVITPSFNQGHFIKETIESVLNQDYKNIEYIVMDGGSTDNTVEILRSFAPGASKNAKSGEATIKGTKKKIIWNSRKDKGQADAINKGIKKSTGDIVMYLNSDDVMLPHTLKIVAKYFTAHKEAMWLTGDYFIADEKGNKIQSFVSSYKKILRKFPNSSMLSIANFIIQPSTFWRRSLVDEIGLFNKYLHYCMDFDYWMRTIKKYKLHVLPNHFSFFRIHSKSKGGLLYGKQFREEHDLVRKYSDNSVIKFLHFLHSNLIIFAYRFIK